MNVVRTKEEIERVLEECDRLNKSGESRMYGMTYEQGVSAMYEWLIGDTDISPLD